MIFSATGDGNWQSNINDNEWNDIDDATVQAVRVATRYAPAPLLPLSAPAPRAPAPPSRRNVAVVCHDQYVLTVTAAPASRVKATLSKTAW